MALFFCPLTCLLQLVVHGPHLLHYHVQALQAGQECTGSVIGQQEGMVTGLEFSGLSKAILDPLQLVGINGSLGTDLDHQQWNEGCRCYLLLIVEMQMCHIETKQFCMKLKGDSQKEG